MHACVTTAASAILCATATAQPPVVPQIRPFSINNELVTMQVSTDGSTIVGSARACETCEPRSVRWLRANDFEMEPFIAAIGSSTGVSADGSVVVGYEIGVGVRRAWRWTAGVTDNPLFPDVHSSYATALSENGAVIVGRYQIGAADPMLGFVYWGPNNVPSLGANGIPSATSVDGRTIVGTAMLGSGPRRASRWTLDNGFQFMSPDPGTGRYILPVDVDRSGTVAVGYDGPLSPADPLQQHGSAHRWDGVAMSMLPNPPGDYRFVRANAVSNSGVFVVGEAFASPSALPPMAQVWDHGNVLALADLLANAGGSIVGWEFTAAYDISPTGRYIVGVGRLHGDARGFIVDRFPGGECYANCDSSSTPPVLNVADFTCFLQRFAAGDTYANCDQSTTGPALNVADFTCFLQAYAEGCP